MDTRLVTSLVALTAAVGLSACGEDAPAADGNNTTGATAATTGGSATTSGGSNTGGMNSTGGEGTSGTPASSGGADTQGSGGSATSGTSMGGSDTPMGGSNAVGGMEGTAGMEDIAPSDTQCGTICDKILSANCELTNVTQAECEDQCGMPVDRCEAERASEDACAETDGTFSCVDGAPTLNGCDDVSQARLDCVICGAEDSDTECSSCDKQNCCNELIDLNTSVDAALLDQCAQGCAQDDTACVQDCIDMYPDGADLFDGIFVCESDSCGSECYCAAGDADSECVACEKANCCDEVIALNAAGTQDAFDAAVADLNDCGPFGGCQTECICGAADTDDACLACAKTNCCDELIAYNTASDVNDYIDCAGACTDQACADDCLANAPVTQAAYEALDACAGQDACATECQ